MSRDPRPRPPRRGLWGPSASGTMVVLGLLLLVGTAVEDGRTGPPTLPPELDSPPSDALASERVPTHDISRGHRPDLPWSGSEMRFAGAGVDRASVFQTLRRRVRTRLRFEILPAADGSDRLFGPSFGIRERSSAVATRRILRQARGSLLSIGPALRDARSGVLSAFSTTRPPPALG